MKLPLPTRPLLWLLLGCLMIAIPLSMIARKEYVLSQGEVFRFRLAPVDPTDPFRGRYMTLSYELERKTYSLPADDGDPGTPLTCYALVEKDSEGFAQLGQISLGAPDEGSFLKLSIDRQQLGSLRLPFGRYYLNEERAGLVETQARELIAEAAKEGRTSPVYALVRIHDGEGVVTALMGPKGALNGDAAK